MKIAQEIKATKNLSLKTHFLSSFLISNRISPYISAIYIKHGIIPNIITIHMIFSGILGAILFSLPSIWSKILGALLIHLWFVLDCSDGEVARYTKTYSVYGRELDYTAHLINHPLFGMSLFFSLFQMGRYDFYPLLLIIAASNFFDYLNRNIIALNAIIFEKQKITNRGYMPIEEKWNLKKIILFITNIFTIYPNFILFGVIIYFIDILLQTNFLFNYLILNVLLTALLSIRELYKFTKRFYKS